MRRSSLTLVAVCTGWGTIPLLVRHVDLPAAAIVFARVWIATAAIGLVVAVRGGATTGSGPARRRSFRLRVVAAGALLAVHWTAMFAAYRSASPTTVVFVVFLAPVGIAVLAPRTLGERMGARTLAALALALAGFALIAVPALEPGTATGLVWAGLSAGTFVGLVLVSKPLAEEVGGLRLNLLVMAVAGVLLVPIAARSSWDGLAAAWPWLVVLGVVHTGIGITLYLASLARLPATHVGILGYLEPVSVVALGWLVLGEAPTAATLLGGGLVVAAGVAVVSSSPRAASVDGQDPAVPPTTTAEVPARVPG